MNSYVLNTGQFAFSHSTTPVRLLQDISESSNPEALEALVASGDLFAVLATELDDIAINLNENRGIDFGSRLDKLTEILLHLQRHYKISRKKTDYTQ